MNFGEDSSSKESVGWIVSSLVQDTEDIFYRTLPGKQ